MYGGGQHALPKTEPLSSKEITLKIVLLGDAATGKSCIATRFASDICTEHYKPTSGLDCYSRKVSVSGKSALIGGCGASAGLSHEDVEGL